MGYYNNQQKLFLVIVVFRQYNITHLVTHAPDAVTNCIRRISRARVFSPYKSIAFLYRLRIDLQGTRLRYSRELLWKGPPRKFLGMHNDGRLKEKHELPLYKQ